jgi:hypothetical protein
MNASVSDTLAISSVHSIPLKSGEAFSAVVPPGKKEECPAGRLLVTIDWRITFTNVPQKGAVVGRNLDDPDGETIEATFDPLPSIYQEIGGPDGDLVALNNGDVLYVKLARTRAPLRKKPAWFDVTFRDDFGPGARSLMAIWRSTDGGQTFKFLSSIDPASVEDRAGALPQFRTDENKNKILEAPYDMGGTDGPLAFVDRATNNVYLTFQCVGYLRDESVSDAFKLSTNSLDKTLVFVSEDGGATWKSLGYSSIPRTNWRSGITRFSDGSLILARRNRIYFGEPTLIAKYKFTNGPAAESEISGWDDNWSSNPDIAKANISANIWAGTILIRSPSKKNALIIYARTVPDKGHGYRVCFYDRQSQTFYQEMDVLPAEQSMDNFVFHLAAIDLGSGPILLYWYDVDSSSKSATIRGRLITGDGEYTSDFAISRGPGGSTRSFDLTQSSSYWYGDYVTAGGYIKPPQLVPVGTKVRSRYVFYPMWVEPDQTVRFAKVECTVPLAAFDTHYKIVKLTYRKRIPPMPPVSPGLRRQPKHEIEAMEAHNRVGR